MACLEHKEFNKPKEGIVAFACHMFQLSLQMWLAMNNWPTFLSLFFSLHSFSWKWLEGRSIFVFCVFNKCSSGTCTVLPRLCVVYLYTCSSFSRKRNQCRLWKSGKGSLTKALHRWREEMLRLGSVLYLSIFNTFESLKFQTLHSNNQSLQSLF